MTEKIVYDAFISYRHAELDQFVAKKIQKKLENFKLPKSVIEGKKLEKTKITRIFRDEDELDTADNLSEPIDRALNNSDFLIVICTPRLPKSKWCLKEIETFLETHNRKQVLLVLAEGEPNESFPEIMTYVDEDVTDSEGKITKVRKRVEPLAVDVRGKSRVEILKAIDIAVIKLAATIFSLNYDELRQRHREALLKKMFAVWSGISVAILLFLIVSLGLLSVILRQRNDLRERYARTVSDAADALLEGGRRDEAIYALRSVIEEGDGYNAVAYREMATALDLYCVGDEYIPNKFLEIPSMVTSYKVSNGNKYIAISGFNNDYHVIEIDSQKEIFEFEAVPIDRTSTSYGFDGDKGIIYSSQNETKYVDLCDLSEKTIYSAPSIIFSSGDGDIVNVIVDKLLVGYQDGRMLYETSLEKYEWMYDADGCIWHGYSADGEHGAAIFVTNAVYRFVQFNTMTGEVEAWFEADMAGGAGFAIDGSRFYMTMDNYDENYDSMDSLLYVIDVNNPGLVQTYNISLVYTNGIIVTDTDVFITSVNSVVMLDKDNFDICGRLDGISELAGAFRYKDGIGIVDSKCSFFVLDENNSHGMEITSSLFGIVPQEKIDYALCVNGKFYYQFEDNYIVEYCNNPRSIRDTVAYKQFGYAFEFASDDYLVEELNGIEDMGHQYIYEAIYSSDKKYLAVMLCDKTLRIYNADTMQLESVIYDMDNESLLSFVYISEEDVYIINVYGKAYILDSKLNCIGDMDYCVGYEDGCFIILFNAGYYKVESISFEEVLKMADEELMDFTPDEEIMEKYIDNMEY